MGRDGEDPPETHYSKPIPFSGNISGTPDLAKLKYSVNTLLYLRFKSDKQTTGKGFKAHYSKGKILSVIFIFASSPFMLGFGIEIWVSKLQFRTMVG